MSVALLGLLISREVLLSRAAPIAPVSAPDPPAIPSRNLNTAALRGTPLMFVENAGQFDASARFQVRRGDTTIHLADDAIWFTVLEQTNEETEMRQGVNLKLSFPSANPHPRLEPFDRLDTHVSFFYGSDPANWRTNVPAWSGVRYVDLYPGVDLEITGASGRWAWRLVVRDSQFATSDVRLHVEGADGLDLDGDHLRLTTAVGDFTLPLLAVEGAMPDNQPATLNPKPETFEITAPFSSAPLPLRSSTPSPQTAAAPFYGTYLGGSEQDVGRAIAVDGDGDIYVAGYTDSENFPTTAGVFSDTLVGGQDAFVAKVHPAGSGTSDLVYATYLGGGGGDYAAGIAVDSAENVYVTGWNNNDFPATPGSFGSCDDGGAFVAKLNPTGSDLVYAGCVTGLNAEGYDVALDSASQAYVSGITGSGLPVTTGAYEETAQGGSDAFVAIVSSDGLTLTYATYLGGSGNECSYVGYVGRGCTLALDGENNVYISGGTLSDNFPTKSAYDSTCGSGTCNSAWDGFVAKLNPDGNGASDLVYATYLGGTGNDYISGVAVDGTGSAYVTGMTASKTDFPLVGAFSPAHGGGYADSFVTKLNAAGNGLAYSSYLGGSGNADYGWDIVVDGGGQAHATGKTNSSNFPITDDAYDSTIGLGDAEVYVAVVSSDGVTLTYATYLGGDEVECENGCAIEVDGDGNIYATGSTASSNFPTSEGAYDRTYYDNIDAFVVRLGGEGTTTSTLTVDFASSTYSVDENDGPATISVALSAVSDQTVTVNYTTIDGSAKASSDYTAVSDVLTFDPGITVQSFDVPIVDDSSEEGSESLTLLLSNANNADLGVTNNPATLTIVDDDAPSTPEAAPFYSTYLGGSGQDWGRDIAVDGDGDAYVVGKTRSTDFPDTPGVFSDTLSGGDDAFVAKINPAGNMTNDLVYATYLGGGGDDHANGVAADGSKNIYVVGYTNSDNFPTTGALASCSEGYAFVVKLDDDGSDMLYGGCIGAADAHDVTLDESNNVYVSGWTQSDSFPVTEGAYDTTYNDKGDAFAAIVGSDGVTVTYATYLGGSEQECTWTGYTGRGCTLAVDGSGDIYLTGYTLSSDLPASTSYNDLGDAFVAKINPGGNGAADLVYCTYLGGSSKDLSSGIAVDGTGNAYVTGLTASKDDFPTTAGSFSPAFNGAGYSDGFVVKLNSAGSGLVYGAFLGGSGPMDQGWDITLDEEDVAYVVGQTNSDDFPITSGAFDDTIAHADTNAYVARVSADGSSLFYATYLGGDSGGECVNGCAIAIDGAGNVYVTGDTGANDFPTSEGAYDRSFNAGTQDVFMVRLPTESTEHKIYLPLVLRNF